MSKEPAPKSALEDTTYYHFKSTPDELAQHYKPREIASGSTMEYTPRVNLNQVSTSWTQKRSWETKDYSSWAKECLKVLVQQMDRVEYKDFIFDIKSSDVTVTGDASVVNNRIGYELELIATFVRDYEGPASEVKITISGLDENNSVDGDYDVTFSNTSLKRVATKQILPKLNEIFVEFIEEFNNFKSQ